MWMGMTTNFFQPSMFLLLHLWLIAGKVGDAEPQSQTRRGFVEQEINDDSIDTSNLSSSRSRSIQRRTRPQHEIERFNAAGRRYWSRGDPKSGGPQLPKLEWLDQHTNGSFYRRRTLLSSSNDENTRTGQDSFHMIGTKSIEHQYGIGSTHNGQPPEHPRNHGKESKSDKSNSGGSGSGTGKGGNGRPTNKAPATSPTKRPTQQPPSSQSQPTRQPSNIQPPSNDNNGNVCQTSISIQFLQFTAIPPAITIFPQDPNVQDIGTRYAYNNELRDVDTLDELIDTRAVGMCTRIVPRLEDLEGSVFQPGGGHCTFTYTINDDDNRQFTIEASGTIQDSVGGTISIIGGTQDAIGAFGQIMLTPVNLGSEGNNFEPEDGDIFLAPLFYLADVNLFVPC